MNTTIAHPIPWSHVTKHLESCSGDSDLHDIQDANGETVAQDLPSKEIAQFICTAVNFHLPLVAEMENLIREGAPDSNRTRCDAAGKSARKVLAMATS